MFKWFDRASVKQSFILFLRKFKAVDNVLDEVYDNLDTLATAIQRLDDGTILEYNSTTHYIDLTTPKEIGYDNTTGYIVLGNADNQENN